MLPSNNPMDEILFTIFRLAMIGYSILYLLNWLMRAIKNKRQARKPKTMAQTLFPANFSLKHPPSVADERAAQLLWDHLNADQRAEVLNERTITIQAGKATMQLNTINPYGTILRRPRHNYLRSVCIVQPGPALPIGDYLLAKKIAFEADPEGFSMRARG